MLRAVLFRCQSWGRVPVHAIGEQSLEKEDGSDAACTNGTSRLEERKTGTTRPAMSSAVKNIVPQFSRSRGSCSNQFDAPR
jgi:hypothetical protein